MAIDLFGPDGSPRAVTTRPAEPTSGPTDTWFQDCVGGVAGTGTPYPARWANRIKAQFARLVRACSITENHADDDMIAKAIQSGKLIWAVDTGTADAMVATLPVGPIYAAGLMINVKKGNNPNATTTPTFNTRTVVRRDGSALAPGDLPGGCAFQLFYDGTNFRLIGLAPSDIAPILAATKSLYNIQKFTTTSRVSASAAGAGTFVDVWTGLSYVKKSATSIVLAWPNFAAKMVGTPGTAYGAVTYRLSIGSVYQDIPLVYGYNLYPSATSGVVAVPGVPAGTQAWGIALKRDDASAWNTIFNPNSASDEPGYPDPNLATMVFAEVEP